MNKLKIVLILDNKNREYNYLQLLKKILVNKLNAEVSLIGSVAEQQRIYYLLYKIKPQIVFLSQAIEERMRDIASYVKKSGGLVFILPAEITVIPALSHLIVNKSLKYNNYVDAIFLPGKRMFNLYKDTDLSTEKKHVVGSPKVDTIINQYGNDFLKREQFLKKYNINHAQKNIFIFTSFVTISPQYLSENKWCKGNETKIIENNNYTLENKKKYIKSIKKLITNLPEYNFILKIHPLETRDDYQGIRAPNFYILPNITLNNCLSSIDLAIHWSSTVATECWLTGIKTLQYVPIIKKRSLSEFSPGNPVISTYDNLVKNIKKYLKQKIDKKFISFQQSYLKDNYYKLDSLTCFRIAENIRKDFTKKQIKVKFQPNFNKATVIFMLLQKLVGLKISRYIASIISKDFNPEYSIKNYVEEIR